MSMYYLENEFRKNLQPGDQAKAEVIAMMLRDRGEDIPLPDSDPSPDMVVAPSMAHLALKSSGIQVLRDRSTDILSKDMVQFASEQERIVAVKERAAQVVEPYNHLFDDRIPGVHTNSRTVRRRVRVGEPRHRDWSYSEVKDGLALSYDYELGYLQGETSNKIGWMALHLRSQHDKPAVWNLRPEPTVSLSFSEQAIHKVSVGWKSATPYAMLKLAESGYLSSFTKEFMVLGNDDRDMSSIAINLTNDTPEIVIEQKFGPYLNAMLRVNLARSTFRYEPATNMYKRDIGGVEQHAIMHDLAGTSLREELSIEESLALLEGILRLIPTTPIS